MGAQITPPAVPGGCAFDGEVPAGGTEPGCESVLEVGRRLLGVGGASKGSGSGSKGVNSACVGWAWACGGPESPSQGVGRSGCFGVRSRSYPCTWGLGQAGRPPSGSRVPPARPSPHGAVQQAHRPALPSVRTSRRLRPAPLAPPTTRPRPKPPPAPPRRSPIQMWVRGERAAPTSQASKMAPGGRL